jgi:N-acetylglucosaminyl-diphospho-decaprenol L-rhamnosyltransferase
MTDSTMIRPPAATARRFTRVHVVTVTYNSASTIRAYLEGLQPSAGLIAGVTVVDNASTDDTVALLRAALQDSALPVEVVENANTGFAGGYRAAAASTVERGVPVLCLNPDVVLAPGAIEALLDALNSFPSAAVVTMPLVEVDGSADTASRRKLPTLHGSVVYSLLGKLTPSAIRYNSLQQAPESIPTEAGRRATPLEATTGALMLVHPDFRSLDEGIFDADYWMYGEDLQLCSDARDRGLSVLMVEVAPSVHIKGVSSGRPRSTTSNRAFHDAMYLYAKKNLVSHPVPLAGLWAGVWGHFLLSEVRATPVRIRRRRARARA